MDYKVCSDVDAQRDNGRFQFSLRSLFWLTTVIAILFASYACAIRAWGDLGGRKWLVIAFLLWPSLAAPIARTCPDVSFVNRVRIFIGVGVGVVFVVMVVFSRIIWKEIGPSVAELVLFMMVSTLVTACLIWAPQGIAVFGVATYAIDRRRRKQADTATANVPLPSQDESPP